MNTYSGLSPRTTAFVVRDLMKRGFPYLVFEKFGQAKPLPTNSTKTMKFRRYYLESTMDNLYKSGSSSVYAFTPKDYFGDDTEGNFNPTNFELEEGVTPTALDLNYKDIDATLVQYGARTVISDVVQDTHEDPVLKEAIDILGEQAAVILEKARFNVLKGCSNKFYAGGVANRTSVNSVFTAAIQRRVTRNLKRNLAKPITQSVKSSMNYGTEPIAPSFIAVCHPDLEYDISQVSGFVPAEKYASTTPMEGEIGKISDVRYILSTIVVPYLGGGASGSTFINTSSVNDVYPIIYLARDAYGLIPLKGKNSITPMVVNPHPSDSDPMAQRGHVSWKAMQTTLILNDAFMAIAEVACTADASLSD